MHVIKSVNVFSVAKIMGLIYGSLGLIFMPFFLLISAVGMAAGKGHAIFSGVVGIVVAVMIPIFYGGIGFIMGAIGGLFYNLFAKWVGGIEFEVEPAPVAPYSL